MFETKHAVSIKADNGAELIVHIGLDTVNLKGAVFRGPCKAGRPGKSGRSSRDGGFRESKRRRI